MDRVFEIFEEILSIPRESGNESAIANYIIDFAQKHNCECYKDKFHNVFIKKNNNSSKTIILQAHSDMVCVSNNNFDFTKKGIPYFIDGDYYKSKNTSLGADDGIGVAIILLASLVEWIITYVKTQDSKEKTKELICAVALTGIFTFLILS